MYIEKLYLQRTWDSTFGTVTCWNLRFGRSGFCTWYSIEMGKTDNWYTRSYDGYSIDGKIQSSAVPSARGKFLKEEILINQCTGHLNARNYRILKIWIRYTTIKKCVLGACPVQKHCPPVSEAWQLREWTRRKTIFTAILWGEKPPEIVNANASYRRGTRWVIFRSPLGLGDVRHTWRCFDALRIYINIKRHLKRCWRSKAVRLQRGELRVLQAVDVGGRQLPIELKGNSRLRHGILLLRMNHTWYIPRRLSYLPQD